LEFTWSGEVRKMRVGKFRVIIIIIIAGKRKNERV